VNLPNFFEELAERFSRERSLGAITISVSDGPVDLEDLALRHAEPADGRRWRDSGSAYDALSEREELFRTAITAIWTSSAPPAWDDEIEIMEDQARRKTYACLTPKPDFCDRPWNGLCCSISIRRDDSIGRRTS